MKEKRNPHLKVQELCDCYATTDPLREMSAIDREADREEAALKWLALAALHGVNQNAESITLRRDRDGSFRVFAKYRVTELPAPGREVGEKILAAVREITHLEGKKGKTPLALGIRNDSLELNIKIESEDGAAKVKIRFPG